MLSSEKYIWELLSSVFLKFHYSEGMIKKIRWMLHIEIDHLETMFGVSKFTYENVFCFNKKQLK